MGRDDLSGEGDVGNIGAVGVGPRIERERCAEGEAVTRAGG
jgi:hypothetical protein